MDGESVSSNLASNLTQWVNEHAKQCADCTRGKMDWDMLINRLQQFEQLIEMNKTVASQLDLDTLLQQIVDTATLLLKAQMGGLLVFDEGESGVNYFKVSGWSGEVDKIPNGKGVLNLSRKKGEPVRLVDVCSDSESIGFPHGHPKVGPFLSVPLMRKDDNLGTLFVGNSPGFSEFDRDDEELLLAFGAQATIAIENAYLYEQTRELARVRERQRIAQALHDTVAQLLFRIGLETQWLEENISLDGQEKKHIETIRRLAGRSSDEMRSAIFTLRSQHITRCDSLIELIQEQIEEFRSETGISATLVVPKRIPSLPPLICDAIYRVVRESLSNVRKHSRATSVLVSLNYNQDVVSLTVQDDGVGIVEPLESDFFEESPLHFGLATMRQLVKDSQGDFVITNNDDSGAIVKIRIQVPGLPII